LQQIIDIGPMSGKSNVIFWLETRGIPAPEDVVDRIFQRAKSSDRCLTEDEILACCSQASAQT
jgi:2-isopropylmalate synthase